MANLRDIQELEHLYAQMNSTNPITVQSLAQTKSGDLELTICSEKPMGDEAIELFKEHLAKHMQRRVKYLGFIGQEECFLINATPLEYEKRSNLMWLIASGFAYHPDSFCTPEFKRKVEEGLYGHPPNKINSSN